mmetsp:Transcript_60468/g.108945  ORF Transcript_60468/g.108945 Transcript_60468/m.108945 type:complete len:313 (-) Transcript_60468:471-1409(-)
MHLSLQIADEVTHHSGDLLVAPRQGHVHDGHAIDVQNERVRLRLDQLIDDGHLCLLNCVVQAIRYSPPFEQCRDCDGVESAHSLNNGRHVPAIVKVCACFSKKLHDLHCECLRVSLHADRLAGLRGGWRPRRKDRIAHCLPAMIIQRSRVRLGLQQHLYDTNVLAVACKAQGRGSVRAPRIQVGHAPHNLHDNREAVWHGWLPGQDMQQGHELLIVFWTNGGIDRGTRPNQFPSQHQVPAQGRFLEVIIRGGDDHSCIFIRVRLHRKPRASATSILDLLHLGGRSVRVRGTRAVIRKAGGAHLVFHLQLHVP